MTETKNATKIDKLVNFETNAVVRVSLHRAGSNSRPGIAVNFDAARPRDRRDNADCAPRRRSDCARVMLALLDAASCAITVGLAMRASRRGGSLRRLSASASGLGSPLPRAPNHGDCVYLGYQATTPVWPEVAEAAAPRLQLHWGNPSSGHAFGRPCAAAVSSARGAVATLVRASPSEILFTSCGSEADNHAIYGALAAEEARRRAGATSKKLPHVVTSNIEHPAIEECLKVLEAEGRLRATYVPCDGEGRVGADAVAAAVTKRDDPRHGDALEQRGGRRPARRRDRRRRARRVGRRRRAEGRAARALGRGAVDWQAGDRRRRRGRRPPHHRRPQVWRAEGRRRALRPQRRRRRRHVREVCARRRPGRRGGARAPSASCCRWRSARRPRSPPPSCRARRRTWRRCAACCSSC